MATETATDTNYTATDQLGSPRVVTNAAGDVVSRRDFLPFGEEIFADGVIRTTANKYSLTGQDAVRQRFTGYQRDLETGLDFAEARYYNNSQGRFTAVDPLLVSGKSANPQTFNRYVYVMNNPLVLIDHTGLQAGSATGRSPFWPSIKAIAFAVGNYRAAAQIGTGSERISISSAAIRFSSGLGLQDTKGSLGTEVNAMRHVVWQALITKSLGAGTAERVGNIHESDPKTDLTVRNFTGTSTNLENADQTADLLNNQIGRQIAGSYNPQPTNTDLIQKSLEYFRDVGLYTSNVNSDGSVTLSQTRITEEQFKTAVQLLNGLTEQGETLMQKNQRDQAEELQRQRDEEERKKNQLHLPGKYQE